MKGGRRVALVPAYVRAGNFSGRRARVKQTTLAVQTVNNTLQQQTGVVMGGARGMQRIGGIDGNDRWVLLTILS